MGNAATDVMCAVPAGYLQLIAWGSCPSSSPWLWMETPLSRRSRKPNRKTYWRSRITREQFASGKKITFRTVYDSSSCFSPRIYRVYVMGALPTLRPNGAGMSLAWLKFPHGRPTARSLDHSSITDEEANNAAAWYHRQSFKTYGILPYKREIFSCQIVVLGFKAIWSEPKRRRKKWFWA